MMTLEEFLLLVSCLIDCDTYNLSGGYLLTSSGFASRLPTSIQTWGLKSNNQHFQVSIIEDTRIITDSHLKMVIPKFLQQKAVQ